LEKALVSEELGAQDTEVAVVNAVLGDIYQNHRKTKGHLDMARTYYMAALAADPANAMAQKGLDELSGSSTPAASNGLPEPVSTSESRNGEDIKIVGTGFYFRLGGSLPNLGGHFDENELGQVNGLAVGAGEIQPYFFLPKVTSGYGFSGSVGRWVGGNFSVELGGFISFLNSQITLNSAAYQRTYLSGNENPNLTAYGADLRFLYELPIPSQFKIRGGPDVQCHDRQDGERPGRDGGL
jgi:hypothetical protein